MKAKAVKTESDIDDLLRQIKDKTGLTQEGIAKRIDYNRAYLSQAKKTDSSKLYNVLEKEFKTELENLTSSESSGKPGQGKYEDDTSEGDEGAWKKVIVNLSESTNRHSIIDERNSRTMERLVRMLAMKWGLDPDDEMLSSDRLKEAEREGKMNLREKKTGTKAG